MKFLNLNFCSNIKSIPQTSIQKFVALLAMVVMTSSCAHYPGVRAGVDGMHRVVIKAEETEAGNQEAIAQANSFCDDKFKKSAAFVDEKNKYTGDMKEGDYKTAKTAAKVAKAAGGAIWALGGKNESNIAGVVGLGGGIADSAIGQGYTIEMKFKCQ
jgi:hypothetical protein